MQTGNQIYEKSKRRTFKVTAVIIEKADAHAHTTPLLNGSSIRAIFSGVKPLLEVNFSKNSTKTTRLFALDFYEVIVDSAFGLINYHLIQISST